MIDRSSHMPGCALRKIVSLAKKPGGYLAKLDCGHGVWFGGHKRHEIGDTVECQTGPCYREQRFMGSEL